MITNCILDGINSNEENVPAAIGRIVSSSMLSNNIDLSYILENVLDMCGSKELSSRCIGHGLFETMMRSTPLKEQEGKVLVFIDRLPGLLDAVSSEQEMISLISLFNCLHRSKTDSITLRLENTLSRLVTSAVRLANKNDTCVFGLSILLELLSSKNPALLSLHITPIRRVCIGYLGHPTAYILAANILSLCFSIENMEAWNAAWIAHIVESGKILEALGITVQGLRDHPLSKSPSILAEIAKDHQGMSKAITLERMFRGCCKVLEQMLINGCSSSFVSIELETLLCVLSAVLSLNIEISSSDPKCTIRNIQGVSAVDLIVILAQLKIHALNLLKTLITEPRLSLLKVAQPICRMVNAVASSREVQCMSSIASLAMETLALASRCFPSTIAQAGSRTGVSILVEMLLTEIAELVKPQDRLTQIDDSNNNHQSFRPLDNLYSEEATAAGAEVIFKVCEDILLNCSVLLEESVRVSIEVGIGHVLRCMMKGILTPVVTDRRLRRNIAEKIRSEPRLQSAILRLATTELLSSHRNGGMGGNLPLLLRAAECCLGQSITASDAKRALLAVECLIHPAAVVLPPMPVPVLVESRLKLRSEAMQRLAQDNNNNNDVDDADSLPSVTTTMIRENTKTAVKTTVDFKRKRDENDTDESTDNKKISNKSKGKHTVPETQTQSQYRFGIANSKTTVDVTAKANSDDDSEDDLPDIDITANPDDD
eukprot:gene3464-6893_t